MNTHVARYCPLSTRVRKHSVITYDGYARKVVE